jgi:4-amino-4-deoxy-L-arabinose transferase-like glycosyltransferase
MVILQATSTQTDLTSGFWCVASVYYTFTWKENGSWRAALLAALAGALALFTKTSSFFFLAPFCALALLQLKTLRKDRLKISAVYVGLFILCASVLHGPHFFRNYHSFGSLAGPSSELAGMNNQVMGVSAVVTNAVRHYGLNLSTHLEPLNRAITTAIRGFTRIVGMDPDDSRNTSPYGSRYTVQRLSTHEDIAANPLQALLLLALLPLMVRSYATAGVASFLFLCTFLRLTPYNVRIHVPFFMLMAPGVAVAADRLLTPRRLKALGVLLAVPALYWVFCNFSRPLLRLKSDNPPSILTSPRVDQYFNNRVYLRDEFKKAIRIAAAANCHHITLIQGNDSWEYALWALARAEGGQWRFEHLVDKSRPTDACAIFSDRYVNTDITVAGARFKPKLVGEHAYLLLREH